ncbi:Gfo/Idh/MocA family protein [Desulfatitalea alkaliphila]|uniref:Gfo/Idh/MocA family oxidoreductase n=1 Tax=Desulfatitalea alkaliphila TaxID=2929485 RepID=A0AA41R477_9BACT|nr:Gfo/Idh/MocA family oxidoreductase [Desulfatitalea alkaliphila]MCJ8500755.1 Gfo/Idh/MocA family oxidoreductase [Desulfatitalea alkaliphila]
MSAQTKQDSKDTAALRVGVVGVGYLGKFHAEKYARMPDVTLVGVVDADRRQADAVAQQLGTRALYDHKELLGQVDAVSIVVPTHHHFAISRDFLNHDVDVLIEKPMTEKLSEADELIRLAERHGCLIQVGHLERFNPAVVALDGVVQQPMFIESHRLSQFKERGLDVSVVLDLMIHDIDIILNFVQSPVKSIHAAGISVISGQVDIANARLEFQCGCVANVTASRISMKNERKIRLFQRDAYISVDFANNEITMVRPDGNGTVADGVIPGMRIDQRCFTKADALDDELKSFVKAVRLRQPPEVTGVMGRDALKIALSIMDQIQRTSQRLVK